MAGDNAAIRPAGPAPPPGPVERRIGDFVQRRRLEGAISRWLDLPLALLALVVLAFLIFEFSADLSENTRAWMGQAGVLIWAIFVAAFLLEFGVAPSKRAYLRNNWVVLLSLAVPPLRVLRVLRVARAARGAQALRGFSTARLVAVLNRSTRALGHFLQRGGFAYVAALTVVVIAASSSAVLFFERAEPDSEITSFGESLWWAATIVTTINAQIEPVSSEGRVVALLLRIFGMAIIGYVTAFIAVWLLGARSEPEGGKPARADLAQLQATVERLEALLLEQQAAERGEAGPWRR